MIQGASLGRARHEISIERKRMLRAVRGYAIGAALLAAIYGVVLHASIGLFQTPFAGPHHVAHGLIGLLNVILLPLLVLVAIIGIRRIWLAGAPKGPLSRLLMAPLWVSFTLSLLTVPIWVGEANAARQTTDAAGLGGAVTYLLAPWGFMLAYGLSLFIVCAMFDFTFPVQPLTNTQPDTAGRG